MPRHIDMVVCPHGETVPNKTRNSEGAIIELTDGRHVRLQTTDPTQSTPPDWQQGQCQRVEWGGKMRWVFP